MVKIHWKWSKSIENRLNPLKSQMSKSFLINSTRFQILWLNLNVCLIRIEILLQLIIVQFRVFRGAHHNQPISSFLEYARLRIFLSFPLSFLLEILYYFLHLGYFGHFIIFLLVILWFFVVNLFILPIFNFILFI